MYGCHASQYIYILYIKYVCINHLGCLPGARGSVRLALRRGVALRAVGAGVAAAPRPRAGPSHHSSSLHLFISSFFESLRISSNLFDPRPAALCRTPWGARRSHVMMSLGMSACARHALGMRCDAIRPTFCLSLPCTEDQALLMLGNGCFRPFVGECTAITMLCAQAYRRYFESKLCPQMLQPPVV